MRKLAAVSVIGICLTVLIIAGLPGSCEAATIYACYKTSSGSVRIVSDPGQCNSSETSISWDSVGPQGPVGPPGPTGATGSAGVSVTSEAVPAGDANCPAGGSKFTSASGVTYACNGMSAALDVAYAHVLGDGTLDTVNSKNVVAMAGGNGLYCFQLTFVPKNAIATIADDPTAPDQGLGFIYVALPPTPLFTCFTIPSPDAVVATFKETVVGGGDLRADMLSTCIGAGRRWYVKNSRDSLAHEQGWAIQPCCFKKDVFLTDFFHRSFLAIFKSDPKDPDPKDP